MLGRALPPGDLHGPGPLPPDLGGALGRHERLGDLSGYGPLRRVLGEAGEDQGAELVRHPAQVRFTMDDFVLHRRHVRTVEGPLPPAAYARTAPSEKTSAAGPTRCPSTCSGAP